MKETNLQLSQERATLQKEKEELLKIKEDAQR